MKTTVCNFLVMRSTVFIRFPKGSPKLKLCFRGVGRAPCLSPWWGGVWGVGEVAQGREGSMGKLWLQGGDMGELGCSPHIEPEIPQGSPSAGVWGGVGGGLKKS